MKKLLRNPRFWIATVILSLVLPVLWLVLLSFSLPEGESFRIVHHTPLSDPGSALLAWAVAVALLLLDLALAASAVFFTYTLLVNIRAVFAREVEFSSLTGIAVVVSLSFGFAWYAIAKTPRLLLELTGINVPIHQVILSPNGELHLVHDVIGVQKSFTEQLKTIHGKCWRSDLMRGSQYTLKYTFEIALEIGATLYLTSDTHTLIRLNPPYTAYHEMLRLAEQTGAQTELLACPLVEKFPPGLFANAPFAGEEPYSPEKSPLP